MDDVLPSQEDVRRLKADPNPAVRRNLAMKIGRSYVHRLFGVRERAVADDIVRAIARDVEIDVRRALAQTISSSNDIPYDVALRLANDVIEVAEPILRDSDLLGDEVLIEIVNARSNDHRRVVAGRSSVSEAVSAVIVEHGDAPVVATLVGNPGARIAEPSLSRAVDRFGDENVVTTPLAERAALPLAIAERLVSLVSERLRDRFASSGLRARDYADRLTARMQEGATLILGGREAETLDLLGLVDQLQAAGKLQPSLVLRAGRAGETELMQAAVSRLAGQKISAVTSAFQDTEEAASLLNAIGLVPAEIDELLGE